MPTHEPLTNETIALTVDGVELEVAAMQRSGDGLPSGSTPKGVRLRKKNREAKQMGVSKVIAEPDALFNAVRITERLAGT